MPINKNNIGFVIRLIGVLIVTIHIFSLVGAAQTSTLEVISDPGGANVYVDDVYKGQTNSDGSPFYIPNIPYGSHIIRIGKSGCNDWSQTYQVSAPTTSVLASLTCPSLLGTFSINSIPDGGGVYIDNNFKGFTPITISNVPYGSHAVKIVKSGYYDWVQNWLAGASPQTITAYLVLLPDTILPTISISSPYNGQSFTTNTITVSGTAFDNIGLSKIEVKVGSGSWQLASGTTSWSKQVTLSQGSNTIYARATDTSGNVAETSVTITYNPDNLPSISITSPSNGQSFTTNTITVSGIASDDVGLSKIEVKVGAGSWQLASGTTSWSKQVALFSGSNTIYARATDTSGKTAENSVTAVYVTPTLTTSATISLSGISSSYNAGSTLSATVYVTNTGETSHTFPIGFSVKDPNGNWNDIPYKTVTLSPSLSSTVYFKYDIPSSVPSGTWTARTAVWDRDAGGGNLQTRYDYKEQTFNVAPALLPDLVVDSISLDVFPSETWIMKDKAFLYVTIINPGNKEASGPFEIRATIKGPNDETLGLMPLIVKDETVNLGVNEKYTSKFYIAIDRGKNVVEAWVDPLWKVDESDETNNIKTQVFFTGTTVTPTPTTPTPTPTTPTPTPITPTPTPTTPTPTPITPTPTPTTNAAISLSGISSSYNAGSTLSATVYVTNTGETSHTFPIGFSVKDPNGNWNDIPYKTVTISPSLSSTVYFKYDIPSSVPSGTWTARTAVWDRDAGGGNLQTRYDYKEQTFNVAPAPSYKPDLVITDISWTPVEVKSGVDVTFSFVIKNQGGSEARGTGPATAPMIPVELSIDGEHITTDFVLPLDASGTRGSQSEGWFKDPWKAKSDSHKVCVKADYSLLTGVNGEIEEDDEVNNQICEELKVKGGGWWDWFDWFRNIFRKK